MNCLLHLYLIFYFNSIPTTPSWLPQLHLGFMSFILMDTLKCMGIEGRCVLCFYEYIAFHWIRKVAKMKGWIHFTSLFSYIKWLLKNVSLVYFGFLNMETEKIFWKLNSK